jgi:hypothetical protein
MRFHVRYLRGNGSHQQRGGQRMTAAGHITTHRTERAHKLAGGEAGDGFVAEGCGELRDGEGANLFGCRRQRFLHCRRDGVPCGGHLIGSDAQSGGTGKAIELRGVAQ